MFCPSQVPRLVKKTSLAIPEWRADGAHPKRRGRPASIMERAGLGKDAMNGTPAEAPDL